MVMSKVRFVTVFRLLTKLCSNRRVGLIFLAVLSLVFSMHAVLHSYHKSPKANKNLSYCDIQSKAYQDIMKTSGKEITKEDEKEIHRSKFCEVTFLGCMSSNTTPKKDKFFYRQSLPSMTKEQCFQFCSSKSLPLYVGLSEGNDCMCSRAIINPIQLLNSTQCSSTCDGNVKEICGGTTAVEWFSQQTPCVKGEELLSQEVENLRLMGCFDDDEYIWQSLLTSECVARQQNLMTSSCILHCSKMQHPLAFYDENTSTCICGRLTNELNMAHRLENCEGSSIKSYKTFAGDTRCKPLRFLPTTSTVKPAALVSFPGSGNTWMRHMLEQASGIYSGSIYGNPHLCRAGFLGECKHRIKETFIIKNHMIFKSDLNVNLYESVLFILRNPYKAYIAEYNRLLSSNQVGHAETVDFFSKDFEKRFFAKTDHISWIELLQNVVESGKPLHLILFEDLLQNPINEIRRVMAFLEEINGFKQNDLEMRLLCLSENIQGTHKRKKKEDPNPYTVKMKKQINNDIALAEQLFAKAGFYVDLSSYKR